MRRGNVVVLVRTILLDLTGSVTADDLALGSRGEDITHAVRVLHDPRHQVLQVCGMVCCCGFLTLLLSTRTFSCGSGWPGVKRGETHISRGGHKPT